MEAEKESEKRSLKHVVNDTGYAFATGAIGGSVYHFVQGTRNSPNGRRLVGGTQAVRMNGARVGGRFGAYGALLSTVEYTMISMRNKEDTWNSIIAGAAAGGILSIRQGIAAASTSALMGGLLLALFRGNANK